MVAFGVWWRGKDGDETSGNEGKMPF